MSENENFIDILFDGPPSHDSGRFVEVENSAGRSINAGEWSQRSDGLWRLRIKSLGQHPYEQSRAYWINVWAGQALAGLCADPTLTLGPEGIATWSHAAAQCLADEIFGKEDEK